MSDQTDFLDVRRDGAVAHIRLNRAAKANSMSWAFWTELPRVMKDLSEDTAVRAVVLSGAGKHFSAGMELSAFGSILSMLDEEPGRAAYALRDLILDLQRAVTTLEECRMPVIAAIQGACLGGAIDLITACDVRLASSDAFFAIEEINIGLTADVGTLQRLPSLIGGGLARELALTGRRFSAEEAKSWGLVNAVHEDHDALLKAASDMAQEIAAKSPLAVAGVKRALNHARDHSVADGLDQVATWNAGMLRPADLKEALEARAAKRRALFEDLPKKA